MSLNHTALSIIDSAEVNNFYVNILGLSIIKQNVISKDMAEKIFNISKSAEVITVGKNDFNIELFIDKECKNNCCNHVCVYAKNRKEIIEKARENNYHCIIIKRYPFDMVFIKDKSNNLFEIKQG